MIVPVSYAEILDAPNAQELIDGYAREGSLEELGTPSPQRELYKLLELSGGFQAFGVYRKNVLIGFASVIIYVLPHYGKKIAVTESIFISPGHYGGGALLRHIKKYARENGCGWFLYSAPTGSRFDRILARRLRHSNNIYVEVLM